MAGATLLEDPVKQQSTGRPTDPSALRREELVHAVEQRERMLDGILGRLEAFVTVDEHLRITFANAAAARLTRTQSGGLLGRDVRDFLSPALCERVEDALRQAAAGRAGVEFEVTTPGGAAYLGTVHALVEGGRAVYVRDITEARRREAERDELIAALEESTRSFEAVFEVSPFAMSLTEMPFGRIMRVNGAFERLFGYSRGEVIGRTSPELGISDEADQAEVARRFREDGVVRELELRRTTRDGEVRVVSVSLDWVTLGRGRAVLTSIRDVTERRQAEAALRASEEALRASERRYRSIVEATGDGLLIGDPQGVITFANRRMADMLGYSLEELVGTHGFDLIFPDWRPAVLDNRAALEEGEVVRGEFKLRRKDGSPIWTVFSSTPMVDAAGEHIGNLTMHSDITALREAQQALQQSELAAAAQEERSRIARDLHDSVTQALFAASLKAEALRTEGGLPPRIAGVVEEVRRLTGGALAQMRAMLLELRGEPLEAIPIRQLLRNVVEATESRTRTRVDLTVEGGDDLPADVHVAVYRIAQEALNNVARHARAEHAHVELLAGPELVRLRVADDGRGFEQRPFGPTHLGLRSLRERAAEVGAELHIASAPGRGTEVVVEWRPSGS